MATSQGLKPLNDYFQQENFWFNEQNETTDKIEPVLFAVAWKVQQQEAQVIIFLETNHKMENFITNVALGTNLTSSWNSQVNTIQASK